MNWKCFDFLGNGFTYRAIRSSSLLESMFKYLPLVMLSQSPKNHARTVVLTGGHGCFITDAFYYLASDNSKS
ncbi:MAG TPA: hypothetical protein VMT94_00500, partial [Burkholderiales bacterium]|nr:hypothetical protein [Burkholderiales bacterium]